MGHSIGHNRLKSFVERIERLKDEQDALGKDIREVYAEAQSDGFDKTALGQVVTIRRKRTKNGKKYEAMSALVELYLNTLDSGSELEHARAHAHEAPSTDISNEAATVAPQSAPAIEVDATRAVELPQLPTAATGGTADSSSPAVSPTHSHPVVTAAREAGSTGEGDVSYALASPVNSGASHGDDDLDPPAHMVRANWVDGSPPR